MPEKLLFAYIVAYSLAFIFGTVIASFLNVVISRLEAGESWVKGRSACPACAHRLAPRDLVPLLSWLLLRRRCRYCGAPISARYPLVEAIGGIAACLCVAAYGLTWTAVAVFALIAGLLAIAFIDWDTMAIPNGLIIYLFIPAFALCFLLPETSLIAHGIGFFAASLPLLLIAVLTRGFGMGDIKLMAVCGLALGWQLILLALFIGIVLGGVYGVYLLTFKKASKGTAFAFGPYLCLGVFISLWAGKNLVGWYIALL